MEVNVFQLELYSCANQFDQAADKGPVCGQGQSCMLYTVDCTYSNSIRQYIDDFRIHVNGYTCI